MKIINIRFKNINNLKGEHVVNFDTAPLDTAGIFAIVGPTGSGKSTLLDVITLALFNRIPRYNRAISKKEIGDLGSVMTHHTDEASASIVYEIKGNRYTSTWSIAKARTGSLKDYEMFIYDSGGTPLDLKKSEVPAQNEQIIGLKYDQFIKSIILSQGEFAKFLKADKNERGQLLENITGSSVYRHLSIAAFEKHKEIKEKVEREKDKIGIIQVMSSEDRKMHEDEIEKLKKQRTLLDKEVKDLTEAKKVKTSLYESEKKLADKKIESDVVNKKISEYAPILEKLKLHEKITPLQVDLNNLSTAKRNAQMSETNLKDYENAYNTAESDLKKVISEMSILCNQDVKSDNFKTVMSTFEKEVNDLDRDLQNIKNKGTEERQRINQKRKEYPTPIDLKDEMKPSEAIHLLSMRAKELNTKLTSSQLNDQTDITSIRSQLKTDQTELQLLKDLKHNFEHIVHSEKQIKAYQKKLNELRADLKAKQPLLKSTEENIIILNDNLELLLKQKQDAIKIANLEELRKDLKNDEPCPLCGSTSHPYSDHLPDNTPNEIDEKIHANKQKVQKLTIESNTLQQEVTTLNANVKTTADQLSELSDNLKRDQITTQEHLKTYKGKTLPTTDTIEALIETKSDALFHLERGIMALDELKANTELYDGYNRLLAIGADYKAYKDKRDAMYKGHDVNQDCNALQDRFTRANTAMEKSKTAIEKETKDLEGAKKLLESLSTKLQPEIVKLGFSSFEQVNDHILDESKLAKIKNDKDQLLKFKTSNETEIKTLENNIKTLTVQDRHPKLTLESIALSLSEKEHNRDENNRDRGRKEEIINNDNENKKIIKNQEKQLNILNKELEKWSLMNSLIGNAKGDKFANFAQGLTLQNLLVYTNKRLQKLSDRYLLDRPTNDGALMVIDQYQGNIQRAVSTLSGGETFLISLALALSLSDMASKNVALDCLFIDEGFGTLDHDTLDVAMTTLEKLQTESQKTVGVISHVEALKERINVQIKLEKNPQGYSRILVE